MNVIQLKITCTHIEKILLYNTIFTIYIFWKELKGCFIWLKKQFLV